MVRFGFELLENNGFKVELWDVSRLYWDHLSGASDVFTDNGKYVKCYRKKEDLYGDISGLGEKDFVVNMVSYNERTIGLYKLLSDSSSAYGVILASVLPLHDVCAFSDRMRKLSKPTLSEIGKLIKRKIPFQMRGIKPAKFIFAGGSRYFLNLYPVTGKTEVLDCHALDYDIYLREVQRPFKETDTAVFIDQDIAAHPDFTFSGHAPYVSAERYYGLMNSVFDSIRDRLGLKTIIAAHPRADIDRLKKHYVGYECIAGKTAELIRAGKMVLTHSSTAINLANLFYKPAVFLTTMELEGNRGGLFIKEMARWFGKKPVLVDGGLASIDWDHELRVDMPIYDNYRNSYIKVNGSPQLPYWQIVADRLKRP